MRAYFGLDHTSGQRKTEDVRSQPKDEDQGYAAADPSGHVPDHVAVIRCLLQHKDLIDRNDMIYLIVDNRDIGLRLHGGGPPDVSWLGPKHKNGHPVVSS